MALTPAHMRTLLMVLTIAAWTGLARQTHAVWQTRSDIHESLASDALPIYLAGAAVNDGGDPTQAHDLIMAYEHREMGTGALFFSTLYPASVGVMVAPLADRPWVKFLWLWRLLMLLGAGAAGVAGGLASVRGPRAWLAAPLGGLVIVSDGAFPLLSDSMGLGQANLLIAGLVGLVILGLSRGWAALAGGAAATGVALKLVPGLLFLPMVMARRWRAVVLGAITGALLLLWTLTAVSLDSAVDGVMGTIRFQQGVFPDWMNRNPAPDWMIFIGALRGLPMGALTLGLVSLLAWRADDTQRRPVLAASAATAVAWLSAHAAAVGVFYGTLLLPALVYAVLWPLSEKAPKRSWLGLPLLLVPGLMGSSTVLELAPEPRMVLTAMAVWSVCMARLLHAGGRLPGFGRVGVVAVAAVGVVLAGVRTIQGPNLPPLPNDGMESMPQGHGAGVGGVGPDRNWNPEMPKRMPGQDQPQESDGQ